MTFTGWMNLQKSRMDAVGDLARVAALDGGFPAGYLGYKAWKAHIQSGVPNPAMLYALEVAWREYGGRE